MDFGQKQNRSRILFAAAIYIAFLIFGFSGCSGNDSPDDSSPELYTWYKDSDNDGYTDGTTMEEVAQPADYYPASHFSNVSIFDCEDNVNTIYPGATEICDDGIDQDCDGSDLECSPDSLDVDDDGDGYTENEGDCNDSNNLIYPGTTEICGDAIDQDCDGSDAVCPSTWYKDMDGDGYSDGTTQESANQPDGYYQASDLTQTFGDSNDNDADIHPGTTDDATDNSADNGCGCDVIDIDGVTFSANGYFHIAQDGDKTELQMYDGGAEETEYGWFSGTEVIDSVETLKYYQSEEGFNVNPFTIQYMACVDNEYRTYRGDSLSPDSTILYTPYESMPIDLVPGETYSQTYTENELDGSEVRSVQMTITDVAYDSVTTHFDTYDDCIRQAFEFIWTYTETGEVIKSDMVFWHCRGADQVRIVVTTTVGGYEYTSTLDTRFVFNGN